MTDMVAALRNYYKSQIKVYPAHTNRASSIGHPCMRFLVYNRTHWSQVVPHSPELQAIFNDGHLHEKQMIVDLINAGVEIFEQQMSLGEEKILKAANITAHIDWKVRESPQLAVPVDGKSASSYSYDNINCYDDMVNSTKTWVRCYPGQLQIYCIATNSPYGYFLYKNKNNSQYKQIKVELDYGYAEELIQKGHEINKHVDNGTLPTRIEYDHNTCDFCRHKTTCNPSIPENFSLWSMEKPEFLTMVRDWERLEVDGKKYIKLNKDVKDILKGTEKVKIILGEYLLTCKVGDAGSQRWKRERLSGEVVPMSKQDTGIPVVNCKDCNKSLDAGDQLLFTDQCQKCATNR